HPPVDVGTQPLKLTAKASLELRLEPVGALVDEEIVDHLDKPDAGRALEIQQHLDTTRLPEEIAGVKKDVVRTGWRHRCGRRKSGWPVPREHGLDAALEVQPTQAD